MCLGALCRFIGSAIKKYESIQTQQKAQAPSGAEDNEMTKRDIAGLAAVSWTALNHIDVVRVHDVKVGFNWCMASRTHTLSLSHSTGFYI